MAKDQDPNARTRIDWVIFRCAEAVRIAGILLQPIMPTKAEKLLDGLGVKAERRTIEFARKDADLEYGTSPLPTKSTRPDAFATLFPPVAAVEEPNTPIKAPKSKTKNRLGKVASALAQEAKDGKQVSEEKSEEKK